VLKLRTTIALLPEEKTADHPRISLPFHRACGSLMSLVDIAVPYALAPSDFAAVRHKGTGSTMEKVHEDRFMLFLRSDPSHLKSSAETVEHLVASCASYAEARRIRNALQGAATGECVIRYVGPTGGGD
jgi:hypothetical protein